MDTTSLLLSVLFGALGLGFLVYGRKAGRLVPAVVGLALMVVPYFISNTVVLVSVCIALTAVPFLLRNH
jgi:hypothetical protein